MSESREYARREAAKRRGGLKGTRGRQPDLAKRAKVQEMHAAGLLHREIAETLGVTRQAVSMMLRKVRRGSPPPPNKPESPPLPHASE